MITSGVAKRMREFLIHVLRFHSSSPAISARQLFQTVGELHDRDLPADIGQTRCFTTGSYNPHVAKLWDLTS